jgi:uncharacterized protein YbaP (TraB family)
MQIWRSIAVGAAIVGALAAAAAPAAAGDAACVGSDYLASLEAEQPALHAGLMRDAERVAFGEGLLFRLEKDGAPALHVFGTIHVEDEAYKQFPMEMLTALEAAEVVATEIKESELADPFMALKMAALAVNPKADTLKRIAEADRAAVGAALASRGMTAGAAERTDAGFLLLSLALPPCAIPTDPEQILGREIVDQKVARLAIGFGAENVALETVAEQIDAVMGMSEQSKFALLVASAAADARATDVFVTLKRLYGEKRIGLLSVLAPATLPPDPAVQGAYAEFMDRLLTRRNRTMAERIGRLAETRAVFAAVGALHLVGEEGVLRLLERQGYRVSRVW